MNLNSAQEIIDDIKAGKMVILMDDEDRENEGDLIIAAEHISAEAINFMATHGRGLICLTMTQERCSQLDLPLMVKNNGAAFSTNFTMSIEASKGVTTGISAADRARTVQAAIAKGAVPSDIVQPGHIFPIMAQPGGVLTRAGHTEAGCDLARLAGLEPSSVIVEILNEDGTMARRPDLEVFAKQHDIKIGTIADLIHYRLVTEKTTQCISERTVNTHYGEFTLKTYLDHARDEKHFAMVMGDVSTDDAPLVRVHINRSARDLLAIEPREGFQSWSTHTALEAIAKEGRGVLVLLIYPETAEDMDQNIDEMLNIITDKTPPASEVVYFQVGTGSQILMDLGISKMRLLSAPFKFSGISGFDLEVVEYVDYHESKGI